MKETFVEFVTGFWAVFLEMAPWLLFGFAIAGVLSVLLPTDWVRRHLHGRSVWSVVKASMFGVPLPLCSCGVIPVGASLRRSGAGRSATTAFLISTPQTGVDSIAVTYSLMGGIFAIVRPLAAFFSGLIGGVAVGIVSHDQDDPHQAPADTQCDGNPPTGTCCEGTETPADSCDDTTPTGCCSTAEADHPGLVQKVLTMARYAFVTMPRDIAGSLVIGIAIAGLLGAVLPEGFFAQYLGKGLLAMLVMMALGVPVYVCATASVPVAMALVAAGATPGAALVFLMTGPATNAATISTIWKTMGRRSAITYLAAVMLTALVSGLVLDALIDPAPVVAAAKSAKAGHTMLPFWLKLGSAIALIGIIGGTFIRPRRRTTETPEALQAEIEGQVVTLSIEGMTCNHCREAVHKALSSIDGVTAVTVDLEAGAARVSGTDVSTEKLTRVVEDLGYSATVC